MLAALRTTAPLFVTLLCLVVLTVRLSGVHAHRDLGAGQESVLHEHGHHQHGHHHGDHAASGEAAHAEGHVDVKLVQIAGALDPLGKVGSAIAAALLVVAFALSTPRRSVPRPPDRVGLRRSLRSHWRPPLRGPPQFSIA